MLERGFNLQALIDNLYKTLDNTHCSKLTKVEFTERYNHKKKANRSGKIPMELLNQLSIKTKLIVMLLVVSVCAMLASTYICSSSGKVTLTEKSSTN